MRSFVAMVFLVQRGCVVLRQVLVSLGARTIAAEDPHACAFVLRAGRLLELRSRAPFDPRDLHLLPDGSALLGIGIRSSRLAAPELARTLQSQVLPLQLRDFELPSLGHAVRVLADGTALVCEAALDHDSLHTLRAHPAVRKWVSIPRGEALRGGLQLLEVGPVLLASHRAPWTRGVLERLGYSVASMSLGSAGPAQFAREVATLDVEARISGC